MGRLWPGAAWVGNAGILAGIVGGPLHWWPWPHAVLICLGSFQFGSQTAMVGKYLGLLPGKVSFSVQFARASFRALVTWAIAVPLIIVLSVSGASWGDAYGAPSFS